MSKNHDQKNQQQKAQPTAGVITPVRAIGPSRERAEDKQDQQNDQKCSHVVSSPGRKRPVPLPTTIWILAQAGK